MNFAEGSLHSLDGRHVLRFERHLPHPPEKVWRAISDPAELAHWFPTPLEMEPKEGTTVHYLPSPDHPDVKMDDGEVLQADPPRLLVFTWFGATLRWEISPDGENGSVLRFSHTFTDRPYAASFASGWESCLGALASLLEGRPTSNQPTEYPQRHEHYSAAFGLTSGEVRHTGEGWEAYLERMLPWPLDTVLGHGLTGWNVSAEGPAGTRVTFEQTSADETSARSALARAEAELDRVSGELLQP